MAATLVLFPIFAAVVFMFAQGFYWQHREEVARAAADKASAAVAIYGADVESARQDAYDRMVAAGLDDVTVEITPGETETIVVVSGRMPGIIRGYSKTITATSATATERYRSP